MFLLSPKKKYKMAKCKFCKDTGEITLFTSVVICDCIGQSKTSVESNSGPKDFVASPHPDFMNGWYSQTYAKDHGQVVYLHATTGKEVTITEITRTPTPYGTLPDIVFVGIIDKHSVIRGGMY
jgi:hypothetical protein